MLIHTPSTSPLFLSKQFLKTSKKMIETWAQAAILARVMSKLRAMNTPASVDLHVEPPAATTAAAMKVQIETRRATPIPAPTSYNLLNNFNNIRT